MSFPFSAWDYRHYSLLHAEEEATYCLTSFISSLNGKEVPGTSACCKRSPKGLSGWAIPRKGPPFLEPEPSGAPAVPASAAVVPAQGCRRTHCLGTGGDCLPSRFAQAGVCT
uniref:Uncharacterized protein n=1 Tax=Ixodes ricinus TaxID=34613 RepID=A0A0K8RM94_IXORI